VDPEWIADGYIPIHIAVVCLNKGKKDGDDVVVP
jgi:hypothetical protein